MQSIMSPKYVELSTVFMHKSFMYFRNANRVIAVFLAMSRK
jgi:hypothetical protein